MIELVSNSDRSSDKVLWLNNFSFFFMHAQPELANMKLTREWQRQANMMATFGWNRLNTRKHQCQPIWKWQTIGWQIGFGCMQTQWPQFPECSTETLLLNTKAGANTVGEGSEHNDNINYGTAYLTVFSYSFRLLVKRSALRKCLRQGSRTLWMPDFQSGPALLHKGNNWTVNSRSTTEGRKRINRLRMSNSTEGRPLTCLT